MCGRRPGASQLWGRQVQAWAGQWRAQGVLRPGPGLEVEGEWQEAGGAGKQGGKVRKTCVCRRGWSVAEGSGCQWTGYSEVSLRELPGAAG